MRDLVLTRLRLTGLPTTALAIEVTGKVAVTEGEEALQPLVQLRKLGVRGAIDDFGTGHSSLSRLRTMPFDIGQGYLFGRPVPADKLRPVGRSGRPRPSRSLLADCQLIARGGSRPLPSVFRSAAAILFTPFSRKTAVVLWLY